MRTDLYINSKLNCLFKYHAQYPIRLFDFIEFYKKINSEHEIIAINIDVENHIVSLIIDDEEKKIKEL